MMKALLAIAASAAIAWSASAHAQGLDFTKFTFLPEPDQATATQRSIAQGWSMGVVWDDPACQPNCTDGFGNVHEPSPWWEVRQINGRWYIVIENAKRADYYDFTANPPVVDPTPIYNIAKADPKFVMPRVVPKAGAITGITIQDSTPVPLVGSVVTIGAGIAAKDSVTLNVGAAQVVYKVGPTALSASPANVTKGMLGAIASTKDLPFMLVKMTAANAVTIYQMADEPATISASSSGNGSIVVSAAASLSGP